MSLPKYKITIDPEFSAGEDLGISQIAFTKRPAIITKGMAFNAVEEKKQFFADKLKYRIAAPAMIPMQIYRNQDNEEFYVEFTEAEIEKIHSKFMKKVMNSNKALFNLEHNSSETVPAYILEAWIVDSPESDKSFSTFGIKVPKGTLFVVAQVTDKEYYASLVENEQTGFSIEGFLGLSLSELEAKQKEKFNQTQINMENEEVKLPEGAKFQIGDVWYEVKDGVIVESLIAEVAAPEEMAEEVPAVEEKVEEEVALAEEVVEEEVKEEEMAEEIPAEDAPVETYTKAEVDAKFDELYKMIAELKSEEIVEEIEEPEMLSSNVALSVADRLDAFVRFAKSQKK